ncbi:MAG TPA: hypothetical protein VJH24_03530 [Candidatus Bilamarchaeaceae archaeon]|nr:hypothetical protein [Candidatus Bilamarchaeaceae archaeon]
MLGWYLGILGSVVGLGGLYYSAHSLTRMSGELRNSLFLLFLGSAVVMLYGILAVVFGVLQLDVGDWLWQLVPLLFFVSSVLFALSTKKLLLLLEKLAAQR